MWQRPCSLQILFLHATNTLQCTDFLLQSAVNITAQFSYMMPYLANIMECADVCIALLQILSDGKAPCNELMLHHAMQCTGASCRMLQIPSNFVADSMQLRDPSSKQPTYGTPILSHGAFTKTWFYTGICTYTCFCPGMVLHVNTFMQRCFCTGMLSSKKIFTHTLGYLLLHTDAWVLVHADVFTQRCFYRGMLLHGILHRVSFDTNRFSLTEDFTANTLTQRCFSNRNAFVQRRFFTHRYFYKKDFCTNTFTEKGFYTQVLLD